MLTKNISKKETISLVKSNEQILNVLKNINWTEEQVKIWKKNRKVTSIIK
jgi:hypothetical protein